MNLPLSAVGAKGRRNGLDREARVGNDETRRRRSGRLNGNRAVRQRGQRGFGARGNFRARLEHEVFALTKDVVEPMERDHLILDRVFELDGGLMTRAIARREPGEGCSKRQRAAVGQREWLEIDVDKAIDVADIGVRHGNDPKVPRRTGGGENSTADGQVVFQMHFDELACVRGLRRDGFVGNENQPGIEGQDIARRCR